MAKHRRSAGIAATIGVPITLISACCGEKRDAPPTEWVTSLQIARGTQAEAHGVTMDAHGNVYATGWYRGTLNACGKPTQSTPTSSPDKDDMFLLKLGPDGHCQWLKSFPRSAGNAITVDAQGNVIVTGKINQRVNFGGGSIGPATPGARLFLASFDPSGAHRWSRAFGDRHPSFGESVAIGPQEQIVVSGTYVTSLEIGNARLDHKASPSAGFVAQFDAQGSPQWSLALGAALSDDARIAVDASGNVVVAGSFAGSLNLGGQPLVSVMPTGKAPEPIVLEDAGRLRRDIFVAKLDAQGAHLWSKSFGDAEDQVAHGVDVDEAGQIYLLAEVAGSVNLGDGPREGSSGGTLVAALRPDGPCAWSKRFGKRVLLFFGGDTAPQALRATPDGVIIAGRVNGSVDFGGGKLGGDKERGFVVAFDRAGAHRWSLALSSNMDAFAYDAIVAANGDLAITGFFHGDVELGNHRTTSITEWQDTDAFVAKLSVSRP